jgi:hypothetical protein
MLAFHSYLFLALSAILAPSQRVCGQTATIEARPSEKPPTGYTVTRIDSVKNLFLIYATRNDSIFKIVSLNQKGVNCTPLKVNGTYPLTLHSRFEGKYAIKSQNIDFNVSYNYYGTFVSLEKERGIRDLFTADNLKGRCVCK